MSFFTTIQNSQAYLQSALNSAASQNDLETQSMEAEQSLQNEDNIGNDALKSSGMSDLFLGAPVALRGLIEAPAVYGRAKEAYAGLKDTYYKIKAKAEELHNLVTTAPEKLKALRDANIGEGLSPEALQAKVVELFGEKIGNSAVGKSIIENLGKYKEAHGQLKQAAIEHYEEANKLLSQAREHVNTVKTIAEKPLESLTQSDLAQSLRSGDIVNQIHGAVTEGTKQFKSALPSSEELTARLEAIKTKLAPTIQSFITQPPQQEAALEIPKKTESTTGGDAERMKRLMDQETNIKARISSGVAPKESLALNNRLEEIENLQNNILKKRDIPVDTITKDRVTIEKNKLADLAAEEPLPASFEKLGAKTPSAFEALAKGGRKGIVARTPDMTALEGLKSTGVSSLKSSILEPAMDTITKLNASTTERLRGLKSQQEELENRLIGNVPEDIRSKINQDIQSIKGKILSEEGNISTSNRISSLSEPEPKIVSAAKGEVDLVEPKVVSLRNKAQPLNPINRIAPEKESAFESLAKEGLAETKGVKSYYQKAKNYLTTLKESAPSKIVGGTLEAGLEGLNVAGGVESARQLAEGHFSAMNVLQTSQLKNAPEALRGAVSTIGEGIKATGERGTNLVENATNTLHEYANKAQSTVSDTIDLLKSHIAESGAEDVAKGIAEKGIGSFLGEAVLGTIPVVGEISDLALGIGSVVEAIKDIGHKAPVAAPAPSIIEGTQVSRQAGVY